MSRHRRAVERRERQRARARLRSATWECVRWALATFPDETLTQQAIHLTKEALELESAIAAGWAPEYTAVADELADVYMLGRLITHRVEALARRLQVDLPTALLLKLAVNRSRTWTRTADGDYQHVREPRA